jgi:DNA polymerase-3 subunit epsilon
VREIVIDTETTGLDPASGHRVVEIAAVELMHHLPTGRKFHCYINPGRDMPADAFAVHGLDAEFLADFPPFAAVAEEFVAFIGEDPLVAHNAEFDLGFLNAELARLGQPRLTGGLVDTLALARKRFPGSPASLDALCRRFTIDLSGREKHGAEIDCLLLAEVYIELLGGRQPGLALAAGVAAVAVTIDAPALGPARPPRPHAPLDEELAAHAAMLATMTAPMWLEGSSLSPN